MSSYNLAVDGDYYEQKYWDIFIKDQLQCYEDFWLKNVVSLTNRPKDIHFKTDEELKIIGKTANDVCIAQLHYSILRHLIRVFDILKKNLINHDDLIDGMTRLSGSLDLVFELLERFGNPTDYDPWLEKRKNKNNGSKEACAAWQKMNLYPLQEIKNYRNFLVHGRILPGLVKERNFCLPKIGEEKEYFDWRKITNPENRLKLNLDDFVPIVDILNISWVKVLEYINLQWNKVLLS